MEQAIAAREALFEESIDSAVAVALWDEDELLGSFELFNTTGGDEGGVASFLEDARKVLRLVAAQLTGSLVARRRREEEEKNSRLASIGQMLSGVLHDIKNPMAIISGYVQIMAKAEDGEARRQYAGSVLKQMDHLNEMTRELLMFARGDRNILLRKVFLHKFMEDLGEMLTAELSSRQVRLELELGYRNEAWLDQVKLKRAILNLARNAAEAMGERGGVFRIETRKEVSADGEELLVLALSDDGPGVPIEIRDRLFDSFVTQGKEHGTGLGLAIVKKVVEDHGGRITFETGTGEGTTFWIRLPLRGEQEG